MTTVRVKLATHLLALAHLDGDVTVDVAGPVTPRSVLDAVEARWPPLRGTIRDRSTGRRRPLVRFLTCGEDVSHDDPDAELPPAVAAGAEPFVILGAIAGG